MTRRPCPRAINPEWSRARWAHLRRRIMKKLRKFKNSREYAYLVAKAAKQSNAEDKPAPQF
uniref:hypothetical protein n=1 Tax=uncultured Caulobacter sp. TaxID=158749 RepID=UPI0025D72F0D|nr:hypothetical protein [uncultured Caulobacter sp.]